MPRALRTISCEQCGTDFQSRKASRFCSKSCIWKATRGQEFNARIAREYAHKRGDAMRGRGEGKGYRKFGGRHEHRVVAEKKIGRPLEKGEVVHHIDGNKQNNHPDNLAVMNQGAHMREHGLGIPGMTLWWKPWEHRRKA